MNNDQIIRDIQAFKLDKEPEDNLSRAKQELQTFLTKFPFRAEPDKIDSLTAESLYSSGSSDYFFLWIEHKTRPLGAIFAYGGKVYPNAVAKLDKFKQLLRILVSGQLAFSKKIDADWGDIKGFGGDRLIAKKILFCYYSEEVLPIFKTDHLESFCRRLSIDNEKSAIERFGKSYEQLTTGEKFELLNNLLLQFKRQHVSAVDNFIFMRFLYQSFETAKVSSITKRESKPLSSLGLLFTPTSEQEVVYLFSNFHKDLGYPYIKVLQVRFPDVLALDKDRNEVRIEIEVFSSDFKSHGHNPKECDVIVCWEDDIAEAAPDFPEIIPLKDFIEDFYGLKI